MDSLGLRVFTLAVIVLASWPAAADTLETTNACVPVRTGDPLPPLSSVADVRDHAPIVIRGDEMFNLGVAAGVCGGSGTAEDPYRIEHWYIDAGNWTVNGNRVVNAAIEISSTTAHVVVQNVSIAHAPGTGILIRDAENVRIEHVDVSDAASGGFEPTLQVVIEDSRNVQVFDSHFVNLESGAQHFTGINVEDSVDVTVRDNLIEQIELLPSTRFFGIHAGNSTGTRIVDNVIHGATASTGRFSGLHLNDEVSPSILRNTVLGPSSLRGTCVNAQRLGSAEIADNVLGRCGAGLVFANGTSGSILRNRVDNVTSGIVLDTSTGATLVGNRMMNAARAFNVTGPSVAHFYHTVTPDNTISGSPILYLRDARDLVVDASGAAMVFVVGSRDVEVHHASPHGQTVGVAVVGSARTRLHDLDVRGNDVGLRILGSFDVRADRVLSSAVRVDASDLVTLSNLTVRGAYVGVHFGSSDASRLEHALVEGNIIGVRIQKGNTVTVASSVVRANAVGGIHLVQPDFARIVDSDLASNPVFGIRHDGVTAGGSRSNVSGNWWGHASGPSMNGVSAGDKLVAGNNAVITHTPWLTAPATGAGPTTP